MSTKPYDEVGNIIAYEQGDLDETETIELFQHLVNNGHAWELQGHYGRTAKAMIDAGLVHNRCFHKSHKTGRKHGRI